MVISQAFPLGLEIGKADARRVLRGHVHGCCPPPPPTQTCSLSSCTLLLSPGGQHLAESGVLPIPQVCRDPSARDLLPFSRRASCHERASQLSLWEPWNLAGRPFLSSHQDISEVTLNLEKESLKTFIYVF